MAAHDIEEDLSKLAHLTDCVRTYSTENGTDQVPAMPPSVGLKVIQGLWLGRNRKKNRLRMAIETIALAKNLPGGDHRHRGRQRGPVARRNDDVDIRAKSSAR